MGVLLARCLCLPVCVWLWVCVWVLCEYVWQSVHMCVYAYVAGLATKPPHPQLRTHRVGVVLYGGPKFREHGFWRFPRGGYPAINLLALL